MGKSYLGLGIAVFFDNFAGTMGTAVFVAFLMSLCAKEVSATQYALLTSLSSVGLRVFGWTGGIIVEEFGWAGFFVATALMAIPGLLMVPFLPIPSSVGKNDSSSHPGTGEQPARQT
jgi:MFS transporter, PAT family, beta-lactamase induction signal transducer AmpG